MINMMDVFHHLKHEHSQKENEIFKRIHEKKWVQLIDKYIYFGAVIGVLTTIPQIYNVWVLHQVAGVSIISWFSYLVAAIVWILYGIGHEEKVIIVTNSCWLIMDILIVVGIIVFK